MTDKILVNFHHEPMNRKERFIVETTTLESFMLQSLDGKFVNGLGVELGEDNALVTIDQLLHEKSEILNYYDSDCIYIPKDQIGSWQKFKLDEKSPTPNHDFEVTFGIL